jgi:hypothetical protein
MEREISEKQEATNIVTRMKREEGREKLCGEREGDISLRKRGVLEHAVPLWCLPTTVIGSSALPPRPFHLSRKIERA